MIRDPVCSRSSQVRLLLIAKPRIAPGRDIDRFEIKLDVGNTLVLFENGREPRACEDRSHRRVAGEELRDESLTTLAPRVLAKYAKQHRCEAMALKVVSNHEGHLSALSILESLVASDSDETLAVHEDEGHPTPFIDRHERARLAQRQMRTGAEETVVNALGRETLVKGDERVEVLLLDRPEHQPRAVRELHQLAPRPTSDDRLADYLRR